jgi:hypothetical protein
MNAISQRKRGLGLSIMLVFNAIVYVIVAIYLILSWVGILRYDPGFWKHESLPYYILVFLIAAIGTFGIWRWKKWGAYYVIGAWGLTGILNSFFLIPTQLSFRYSGLGILLGLALFRFLLPAWQGME